MTLPYNFPKDLTIEKLLQKAVDAFTINPNTASVYTFHYLDGLEIAGVRTCTLSCIPANYIYVAGIQCRYMYM